VLFFERVDEGKQAQITRVNLQLKIYRLSYLVD
jgi:hypothetical protein